MRTPEDLNMLLDNAPELDMESSGRTSVVDWAGHLTSRTNAGYFQISDVEAVINADFLRRGLKDTKDPTKPKTIYYSQVLGWIRRVDKKGLLTVVKKKIPDGQYKGLYYNITTPTPVEKTKTVAKKPKA